MTVFFISDLGNEVEYRKHIDANPSGIVAPCYLDGYVPVFPNVTDAFVLANFIKAYRNGDYNGREDMLPTEFISISEHDAGAVNVVSAIAYLLGGSVTYTDFGEYTLLKI